MKYQLSNPMTRTIIARDTLKPLSKGYAFASIDRVDACQHFGKIICFGTTQEEADSLADQVTRLLNMAESFKQPEGCFE